MSVISEVLALPNDSRKKTFIVAFVLCLICSIAVSSAAVLLKPIQDKNKQLDKQRNIVAIADLAKEGMSVNEAFSKLRLR